MDREQRMAPKNEWRGPDGTLFRWNIADGMVSEVDVLPPKGQTTSLRDLSAFLRLATPPLVMIRPTGDWSQADLERIVREVEAAGHEHGHLVLMDGLEVEVQALRLDGWVPVDNRLPEYQRRVLVSAGGFDNGQGVGVARLRPVRRMMPGDEEGKPSGPAVDTWFSDHGAPFIEGKITHWQPLPPSPAY